jgi:hypothetical protein
VLRAIDLEERPTYGIDYRLIRKTLIPDDEQTISIILQASNAGGPVAMTKALPRLIETCFAHFGIRYIVEGEAFYPNLNMPTSGSSYAFRVIEPKHSLSLRIRKGCEPFPVGVSGPG